MSDRGVLYIVWGDSFSSVAQRSIASIRQHHPELPIHVVNLGPDLPSEEGLLQKSGMFDLSPFETTLFLDADTVALGRLDFAFAQAERYGVACAICECPWAGRYAGLDGDIIEYNTGVLFFSRRAKPLFDRWRALAPLVDSSFYHVIPGTRRMGRMGHNDQASFARAVEETGFLPAVLPLNWNFRPKWHTSFFGPIRIWHDYAEPPEALHGINNYYATNENPVIQWTSINMAAQ